MTNLLMRMWCAVGIDGGHSWKEFPELGDTCIYCGRKRGHRQSSANPGSAPGAVPLGTPGERPGGVVALAGASARPEPVAQEILAERAWQLGQDEAGRPVLWSLVHPVRWEGPTLVAEGTISEDSSAGIYAQKVLEGVYMVHYVMGVVALSGIVVEGANGYRAERATVRSLRLRGLPVSGPHYNTYSAAPVLEWPKPWDVVEQLAHRYQCEVTLDWLPISSLPASYVTA